MKSKLQLMLINLTKHLVPTKYLLDFLNVILTVGLTSLLISLIISTKSNMPASWEEGLIVLISQKGDREELNNYRPITLLNSIYKIWTIILANRITPIMNYLTNDIQCDYKKHKSTSAIIFYIKQNSLKMAITATFYLASKRRLAKLVEINFGKYFALKDFL